MIVNKDLIDSSISRQPDLDKLIAQVSDKNPSQQETQENLSARLKVIAKQSFEPAEFALERLIGKSDLLPFSYLKKGEQVGTAVGRILVKDAAGQLIAYGTGFMISPVLMMTNKHVLPAAGDVYTSQLQFNYELDMDGNINSSTLFDLDPVKFFYADPVFDFSITGVKETDTSGRHQVFDFGYIQLNPEKGKVALGEYLSIIQHPDGREKQIAIRENQVVDHVCDGDYIWYKTDTAPGSSGSPVFNDQWQLVALHHMGVPETDAAGNYKTIDGGTIAANATQIDSDKLLWKANEGIRVSRICAVLQQLLTGNTIADPEKELIKQIVGNASPVAETCVTDHNAVPPTKSKTIINTPQIIPAMDANNNGLTITVPLNITISLGAVTQAMALPAGSDTNAAPALADWEEAKIVVDPDYANRPGFDVNFLDIPVGLPVIKPELINEVAPVKDTTDNVLKYYHFSIVMNKPRKMAWFTAVNIDSVSYAKLKDQIPSRKKIGTDYWYLDPRLDQADQIHKEFYAGNDFDIGHQVRREDPVWGDTLAYAIKCNNDTFHLANACPQHKEFNQGTGPADAGDDTKGKTLWQGLENYILDNARQNNLKVNVYTGPVLGKDDKEYQQTGIRIPEAFWKVVVLQKASGGLSATAYLVSQASLIQSMLEEFVFGKYRTYQVAVKHIEELTGLSFNLSQYDPLDHLPLNTNEALELNPAQKIRPINTFYDIVF